MKKTIIFLLFSISGFSQNKFLSFEYDSTSYSRPVTKFIEVKKYPRSEKEFQESVHFLLHEFQSPDNYIDLDYLFGIKYKAKGIKDWEFEKAIDVLVLETNKFIRKGFKF